MSLNKIETKRLNAIESERKASDLHRAIITEFKAENLTIRRLIEKLSEASIKATHLKGKGVNIVPLFNHKEHTQTRSYTIRNQSIAVILDTICADFEMKWNAGISAVTIAPK